MNRKQFPRPVDGIMESMRKLLLHVTTSPGKTARYGMVPGWATPHKTRADFHRAVAQVRNHKESLNKKNVEPPQKQGKPDVCRSQQQQIQYDTLP